MRRTTPINHPISASLPYEFHFDELSLAGWGTVDFHAQERGVLILLEVENTQKHPNTNVTKIWPYLECELTKKILLIHVFTNKNTASPNRVKLCSFIGDKLESLYPDRFRYYKYNWPETNDSDLLSIATKLNELA